ncbi:TPA: Arm DNA-binding domain-containing protein, partial [Neisseria meningitidis]
MAKIITPLSANQVKNAKPRDKLYKLSDGGGLALWVYPTG